MMNTQNAINDIHALVANGEVNDSVAEKLLAIAYWLEAELEDDWEDDGQPDEYTEWQDVYGGDDWDHGQYDDGSDLMCDF